MSYQNECIFSDCKTTPVFNFKGQRFGLYCVKHKLDGMINITSRKCIADNCEIRAIFNYIDEPRGLYCTRHKASGMINVYDKKCGSDGCITVPYFNFIGEKSGLYCARHKSDGMINVRSRKCASDGCQIQAHYNYQGSSPAMYCGKHKSDGMINIHSKKCNARDCHAYPSYNFENEKLGLYCGEHKLDGMVNKKTRIMLCKKSNNPQKRQSRIIQCAIMNCTNNAYFTFQKHWKPIFCANHKLHNMIDVRKTYCSARGCKELPDDKCKGQPRPRCRKHAFTCVSNEHYDAEFITPGARKKIKL